MQLDVKIPGIDERLLTDSLLRARSALDSVLTIMRKVQKKWRTTFKDNVPVFETIPIAIYQRHILFRSGGFNAKLIESETGAKVSKLFHFFEMVGFFPVFFFLLCCELLFLEVNFKL